MNLWNIGEFLLLSWRIRRSSSLPLRSGRCTYVRTPRGAAFKIGWVCEELDTLLDRGEPTDGTAFEPDIPVPPAWQAANAMRQTSASMDRERVAIQWKPH